MQTVLHCSGDSCQNQIVVNEPVSPGATYACREHTKGNIKRGRFTCDWRDRFAFLLGQDEAMLKNYREYVGDWQERVRQHERIAAAGQHGHFCGAVGVGDQNK